MVITLVIDTFYMHNNGITTSAMNFAFELKKRGHSVRVLTCGDPANSGVDENGLEMYYLPELKIPIATYFAHKQNTLFAKPIEKTLEKAISGADVVHIYEPWPLGRKAGKIARRFGVPTIAAFHIQPENITYNIGLKLPLFAHIVYFLMFLLFYRKFSHIHCPSKFIAAQLRSHGYRAWLHVISNGVEPIFKPVEREPKKPGEPYKLLMIGRLSPEKRQDIVIRAVSKSKYADRIQLYFAGYGPWEKKLKVLGKKLPNPPIFGYYNRQEVAELIEKCDLYIHASDIEIEGISCMEAFSSGLVPIISDSKRSATSQFALSRENLFKAGSPKSLAERIDYWLDNPDRMSEFGKLYAEYGKNFRIENSVRQMERVYNALSKSKKNIYHRSHLYKIFTQIFYKGIAAPLLFIWTRVFLGAKVKGTKNLRGLSGGIVTVCNHVHLLDSAVVALAFYPRKVVFTTIPENLNTLWPGTIVNILGGVAIPDNLNDLKVFFDEMELLLLKGRVIHFFPEGDLKPYDTDLRSFKKGAFYLAAKARVPVVPMSISFRKPKGLRKLFRKKPLPTLHILEPIYPISIEQFQDVNTRMKLAHDSMKKKIEVAN
ncbi:MAG TPA: glycosyltransferase [Clostridiales bacterium]|nr:glycosyltransferase [Clostridiales bacterium]